MSNVKKGGWNMDSGAGAGGAGVKIDLSQKTTKKQNNIWDLQEEEVVEIPEVEEETFEKSKNKGGNLPAALTKVQDLAELYQNSKTVTLPAPDDSDIDLSILISTLKPPDELQEKDEPWEFVQLKTEIYEIVNNFYSQIGVLQENA